MGERGKRETRSPQSKTSMSSRTRAAIGDVMSSPFLSMYFHDPFVTALTFTPRVDFDPFRSREYNIVA
jgi:hypothetical protein